MKPARAFSFLELLLAVGLLVVAILAVAALTISAVRSSQEAGDQPIGKLAAQRLMEEAIYQVQNDQPSGAKSAFWSGNFSVVPWEEGTHRTNATTFTYAIYAQTVDDSMVGGALGTSTGMADNRVKWVDVVVTWFDADREGRTGYGRLQAESTRLVNETE
ncbi:MAG: hypothetical protein HY319_17530 [Armatimonadetes bacterium]|nr:hypothetical protein [Armatimonadota bacterium]